MSTNLDVNMSGKVSLSEWLVAMKANADKSADATREMLALYDEYLSGRDRPVKNKQSRDLGRLSVDGE